MIKVVIPKWIEINDDESPKATSTAKFQQKRNNWDKAATTSNCKKVFCCSI